MNPLKGIEGSVYKHKECDKIVFKEDQLFWNVKQLRDILKDYSIDGGYDIKRKKNDLQRVTAVCNGEDNRGQNG